MMRSRYLNDLLRRTTPEQAVIKKKAHATTVAVCALIVPSSCAIFLRQAGIKEDEPDWVSAAQITWAIHAACLVIALFFWITEKPRLTKYLPVDSYDDDAT